MPIYFGNSAIGRVFVGSRPVARVYSGSDLVWESVSWDFVDDFERSSIGNDWEGSGALIAGTAPNRHLKKDTTAGNANYWTTRQFDGDDFVIEARLGPVQDAQRHGSLLIGAPSEYIYTEFSRSGNNMIGQYDGRTWSRFADLPARAWDEGDVVSMTRKGNEITVFRNGSRLASGTSSVAQGLGLRRVGLTVQMDINLFVRWYGPTFDDVRVRTT